MTPEELAAQEESKAFESEMFFNKPAEETGKAEPAKEEVTETLEKVEEQKEEPTFAGYKESELKVILGRIQEIDALKDTLNKFNSRLSGQIGDFQERLKKIQADRRGPRFKGDATEKLKEEFPDLAGILFDEEVKEEVKEEKKEEVKDLPKEQPKEEVKPLDEDAVERMLETKLVKKKHKDLDQIKADPMFHQWLGKLPAAEFQTIMNTWDSDIIIGTIDRYKSETAESQKKQKTESRFKAAVAPKGTTQPKPAALSPEEEERLAFESEMYG